MNTSFSSRIRAAAVTAALTWNWSNWWEANAYIEIYNPGICRQSVARLGDTWKLGESSRQLSKAYVSGFNFTHEAYQRGC